MKQWKWILAVLLLITMGFSGCGQSGDQVYEGEQQQALLDQLVEANKYDTLLDQYPFVELEEVAYDSDGNTLTSRINIIQKIDGQTALYAASPNDYQFVHYDGKEYTLSNDGVCYVVFPLSDEMEQRIRDEVSQAKGLFFIDEHEQFDSVTKKDDTYEVLSSVDLRESPKTDWMGYDLNSGTLHYEAHFGKDLMVSALKTTYEGEDCDIAYTTSSYLFDGESQLTKLLDQFSKSTRTVTLVTDPGTDQETIKEFQVPANAPAFFFIDDPDDGYGMYYDKEGTRLRTYAQVMENLTEPLPDETLYLIKQ